MFNWCRSSETVWFRFNRRDDHFNFVRVVLDQLCEKLGKYRPYKAVCTKRIDQTTLLWRTLQRHNAALLCLQHFKLYTLVAQINSARMFFGLRNAEIYQLYLGVAEKLAFFLNCSAPCVPVAIHSLAIFRYWILLHGIARNGIIHRERTSSLLNVATSAVCAESKYLNNLGNY